jgi:gelsolin
LDHKIKAAAASGEPQWEGLGDGPGLKVWRIEQFRVVPWPESQYGQFHTGDSYVVLNSYLVNDALKHDIHIWIGAESSQDEYGTAAYKMVEADERLGGAAIQHREVQGHESAKFASYFNNAIQILQGGCESGFRHVEPTVDQPHLYRIKGTEKAMELIQMDVSKSSLNAGDSFLLFANKSKVWVWHGAEANPDEKARANRLGESMCTQGTVVTLEQDVHDDDDAFWKYLGTDGSIGPADHAKDEEITEFAPLLFRIDDPSEPVAKGEPVRTGFRQVSPKLPKSVLSSSDVYLLDGGWELFVWIGSDADRSEKVGALSKADAYCQQNPRTSDLPLTLVKAGYESSDFNFYFVE